MRSRAEIATTWTGWPGSQSAGRQRARQSMNGSESPRSHDAAPQIASPHSRRFLLESIFLGPNGLRAGWRATLFVAMLLFLVSFGGSALRLLHLSVLVQAGPITPFILGAQEGLAALCSIAAALIMSRLERRRFGDYGMPLRQAFGKNFWLGTVWGIAAISALMLVIRELGGYSFGMVDLSPSAVIRYGL